jgi:tetratricopeptide (TPR) repeat protein
LVVTLASAFLAWPHLRAWAELRQGRAELERYHAEPALAHLEACLRVWPENTTARLLAARAARRAGRLDEAAAHLDACQQRVGATEPVLLEWALQHAAAGDLAAAEPYLQERMKKGFQPDGALVCEALTSGYLRMYRLRDAHRCLARWLEEEPEQVQALLLRARLSRTHQMLAEAAGDYRRVLELDRERRDARWELALCLVKTHDYREAERLLTDMTDAEAMVQRARCREGLGDVAEAITLLDTVLESHPEHGLALSERSRLALGAGEVDAAERWLRRCLAVTPEDINANILLADILERQSKTADAARQRARVAQLKQWSARLREIADEEMSRRPFDADLLAEIGTLEVRLGSPERGGRWLMLALKQAPELPAAHAGLAEYFDRQGDSAAAAAHRARATETLGRRTP